MSEVEGCNLACITKDFDRDRFQIVSEQQSKRKTSQEDSDADVGDESEDSMFDEAPANINATLVDTKSGRSLEVGKRIKL